MSPDTTAATGAEVTAEALAIVEAVATGRTDVAAAVIAHHDAPHLRRLVTRLSALVDLRVKVGDEDMSTAEWAGWLREQHITL